jgi:hypothetical protein
MGEGVVTVIAKDRRVVVEVKGRPSKQVTEVS